MVGGHVIKLELSSSRMFPVDVLANSVKAGLILMYGCLKQQRTP
jgi:hypothetical protein